MLKPNQIVKMPSGVVYYVAMVNECRAMLIRTEKKHVSYKTRFDRHVEFVTEHPPINVSPEASLEIIGEMQ